MRALTFLLAWTSLLMGSVAMAGGTLDRNTTGDGVAVTVTSPFSDLPPGGCVPYQVNIRNDRNIACTWRILFQASATISPLGATCFEQELTVAPNSSGSFNLLVPLPIASESGNTSLTIGVKGPGFDNSSVYKQFFAFVYSNNTGSRVPFSIIGDNVLGSAGLGPLEFFYKDRRQVFYGSDVESAGLPADWRAYSGVANVILKDTEWLALSTAQREAISDYVAQGGHLTLFTSENIDSRIPELQLPGPDGKPGNYGFGAIAVETTPDFPPSPSSLSATIEGDAAISAKQVDLGFFTWGLRDHVGRITLHTGFILSFVVFFGALVGPVNLFVFARGAKRFRLFWTTPLISILASVALLGGILVTDGLGGSGQQLIATYSLPGFNREVVIQEQIARTAVLFSNRWHSDQNYLIAPVSESAVHEDASAPGYRAYRPRTNLAAASDAYLQQGNEYSGNWFRSRSVSGQYLQTIRPSRSVLTVMNSGAFNGALEAPVVLSSFPQQLSRVFLVDLQGHVWTCEQLEPGRAKTCVQGSAEEFKRFWTDACADAGGKLGPLLSRAYNRAGCFYATGQPAAGESLATLDEIHWQAVKGVYLGPWVASATSEKGP